jgi:hypothetical protein
VIDSGGGGGLENSSASPTIVKCEFICNTGAHWAAMGSWNGSNPVVRDCLFMFNGATWTGGAVGSAGDDVGSDPLYVNYRFIENLAGGNGGASWNGFESNARFINCLFLDNEAFGDGGAAWNAYDSTMLLSNCTLMWNQAAFGGAIQSHEATATVVNSIVWENGTDPILDVSGAHTSVTYTDIQFGYPGTGNIAVDPKCWDEMVLLPGSPCIDAGNDALLPPDELDLDGDGDTTETIPFDIDGLDRIAGSAVDMGCYEWHLGDINRDGVVDGADLGFLLGEWGCGPRCPADLDASGHVDGGDLGLLMGSWG